MVVTTAVAAFVVVFSLIACKTLVSQAGYQNRVISAKKKAVSQLKDDLNARDSLVVSYKAFNSTPTNMIGGSPTGTGAQDGDNATLTLDALPSSYDFPALATTLEKILSSQNLQIQSITGTDQALAQSTAAASGAPQAVAMPFQIQVTGQYDAIKGLVSLFDKSIRPFQIQTMDVSGNQSAMSLTLSAQTFYQPEKTFNVGKEVVK
ncbi:MAG TPA: hypothetical protein VLG16_06075 [Candidatus Saccharimonadales bacterium]|nr:hypothetical protein [Candidatus Saccharimonadales bacterium]